MQQSFTQDKFNTDDLSPWQVTNQNYQVILKEICQQQQHLYTNQDEKNKFRQTKSSYAKINQNNLTTTNAEFPIRCLRNRVKSIDQTQRQVLQATPVKLSKEFIIHRNTADFPKHTLPRNFLSFWRYKKQNDRKKTQNPQEINPSLLQLQIQIKKMEQIVQQQKKYSWEIGTKRTSNPKVYTFLNTLQ